MSIAIHRKAVAPACAAAFGLAAAILADLPSAAALQSPPSALAADLAQPETICKGSANATRRNSLLLVMAGEIRAGGLVQIADAALGSMDVADNLDLFEKLGLMEGHLMIGKALLDAGMQSDALPHFGHPVKELYGYLKPAFAARSYPEFDGALTDLERRAKEAPKDPATGAAYDAVIAKIDGLRKTIPAELFKSPEFLVRGIALLMEDSADDLGESLEKGRIVNTVEYHDAMGFARYTDGVIRASAAVLGARAPALAKEMTIVLAAFPSLAPPDRPVRSVADLRGAADRTKTLAQ